MTKLTVAGPYQVTYAAMSVPLKNADRKLPCIYEIDIYIHIHIFVYIHTYMLRSTNERAYNNTHTHTHTHIEREEPSFDSCYTNHKLIRKC